MDHGVLIIDTPEVTEAIAAHEAALWFGGSTDRPILFSALGVSEVLLTLNKADFADVLGGAFYG